MTVEELAKLGEWEMVGDLPLCRVGRCFDDVSKFVKVKKETWLFCDGHFKEYLRVADAIREQNSKAKGENNEHSITASR